MSKHRDAIDFDFEALPDYYEMIAAMSESQEEFVDCLADLCLDSRVIASTIGGEPIDYLFGAVDVAAKIGNDSAPMSEKEALAFLEPLITMLQEGLVSHRTH